MMSRVPPIVRQAAMTGGLLAGVAVGWPAVAAPAAAQSGARTVPETAATAAAPPPPAGTPLAEVQNAVSSYQQAFTARDAEAAKAVWPSVNERALKRAFDQLASQELTFADCQTAINEAANRARVNCRGSVRFVPRIGEGVERVQMRTWDFVIRRQGGHWQIESVESAEAVPPVTSYPESPANSPIRTPR
jgi:hypothetical protein